jgi:hypothetical protein
VLAVVHYKAVLGIGKTRNMILQNIEPAKAVAPQKWLRHPYRVDVHGKGCVHILVSTKVSTSSPSPQGKTYW